MTTTITTGRAIVTLLNTFTVVPENQQALIDLLIEATETAIKHRPGYISTNLHESVDGTRVINYAQWERQEDAEALFSDSRIASYFAQASQLATNVEPHFYAVSFVDSQA